MFKKSNWTLKKAYSYWAANKFSDLFRNFDWKFKNPLKLIYRIIVRLFFKQIIMGKDQWHIIGLKGKP